MGLFGILSRRVGNSDASLLRVVSNSATHFCKYQRKRYCSFKKHLYTYEANENFQANAIDFTGGRVAFTPEMRFISEASERRVPCYRVIDDEGCPISSSRFTQYREHGVLLWRGFSLQEFANQCFGNNADYGKGRQMPIHYGTNKLNYFTVSSPIGFLKKNACVVTYFGDGGTSEGDFHAGLNFAAVMEAPVVFICRNNGWAISTPVTQQFRSDGIVVKGQAYGIRSIRIDGNDALAVYSAIRTAREVAINEQRPILIEALTYRVGHHSTSDDSTKYRPIDEIEHWRTARDPLARFRKWVERNGCWSDDDESQLRGDTRKQLLHAIQVAEKIEKRGLGELFTDVYNTMPSNLQEQERFLRESVKKNPQDYPTDVPI